MLSKCQTRTDGVESAQILHRRSHAFVHARRRVEFCPFVPGTGISRPYIQVSLAPVALFLSLLSDPVGAKAPKYHSEDKIHHLTRRGKQNFALLCQAQGFPVPKFR